MKTSTEAAIRLHAEQTYPNECCGLVVAVGRKEKYFPCRNLGDLDHFVLDPKDYAAAEDKGKVIAVVHSHPDANPNPSEADLVGIESSGLPWLICFVSKEGAGTITMTKPSGYKAPLVGRMFYHGTLDCYGLVKDFYERELGIELPDFLRKDEWWNKGEDLYMENFRDAGFSALRDDEHLDYGDLILMQIRAPVVNHAGIFLGEHPLKEDPTLYPVHNCVLHHMYGHLSERVVYGGYWAEHTRLIIRYRNE